MPKIGTTSTKLPWVEKKQRPPHKRKKNNQKFYNSSAWRAMSHRVRALQPLCQIGKTLEDYRPAQVTDHIIPIIHGGAKFDERNLMALSRYYHDKKSAMESSGKPLINYQFNENGDKIPLNRNDIFNLFNG